MTTITADQINTIAFVIADVLDDETAKDMILEMNKSQEGSNLLRLIVRDDICGAADRIADALWTLL